MPEDIELNSLRRLIKHQLSNPKSLNATKLINSGIDNANNITREQFIDDCSFTTKSETQICFFRGERFKNIFM